MNSSVSSSNLVTNIQFTLLDEIERLYYSHARNGDAEDMRVGMPGRAYECWLDLVIGRLKYPESGCTPIPSAATPACRIAAIYDARRALDRFLGEGWGKKLIRSHHWGEYSLAIPCTSLRVHPSIVRLGENHVSPKRIAALLRLAEERGVLIDA